MSDVTLPPFVLKEQVLRSPKSGEGCPVGGVQDVGTVSSMLKPWLALAWGRQMWQTGQPARATGPKGMSPKNKGSLGTGVKQELAL